MNRELYYCEEEKIKELLMYRKIVKVENDTLYLDNGVELEVFPNEGCGGCNSGWYSITELNECDNVITNVEFECEDIDDEYDFILDNSLSIQDKIYRYMNKQYDDVMSMELLSSYLKDALN